MKKINFLNIEYFVKVAETLNFTKAAGDLHISQPALSKQIKKFESDLEVSLFQRSTKQVELTTAGELMYQTYKEMIGQMDEALQKAKIIQEKERSTIRIGILEFPKVQNYMETYFNRFKDMHPELNLIFEVHGFTQLKEKLENGTFDIVFSLQQEVVLKTEWIQQLHILPVHLGIIVPARNHFYQRKALKVSDLSQETFYIYAESYSDITKKSIKKYCAEVGFCPMSFCEFPNALSLEKALVEGDGLTIGYKEFFEAGKKLKFFPIESVKNHFFVAAWKRNSTEKLQQLLSYLEENV